VAVRSPFRHQLVRNDPPIRVAIDDIVVRVDMTIGGRISLARMLSPFNEDFGSSHHHRRH
jgi:hypothetical protein